ncbi:MAG: type III pantothenate kinase [Mariprofundaceae bacterium]|nr:type III pantothenate kinase [Mariprofundaceae bacterium]
MTHHWLCIDVGNTQMEFGLYVDETLTNSWRLSTYSRITADELAWKMIGMFSRAQQDPLTINGIMVASVVPHLDTVMHDACASVCKQAAMFVGSSSVKTGIAIDYKNPREVGADRLAAAIAARDRWGSPVIIMDCGTATTFDIVSPEGRYAGGLIVPGMEISLSALCKHAARLPEVSIAPVKTLIGRDTVSSMQAGSYWAAVDGLRGIIHRLQSLPLYAEAPLIATGGLSLCIEDEIPEITARIPDLTLCGLHLLAKKHFIV